MRFSGERRPVEGRDAVDSLAIVKGSEVERTVDEGVGVEDVDPEAEWFEIIGDTVRRGCVIGADEVECGTKVGWCRRCVKFWPVSLINGVESGVGRVEDEEVDEKPAIIKAIWVKCKGVLKCNLNEIPFVGGGAGDTMGDEEEFVIARREGLDEERDGSR